MSMMPEKDRTLNRRTFVKGTGATAVGATVTSGVASAHAATGNPSESETERPDDEANGDDSEADEVTLVAHRGFAGVNPENTVRAVRNASQGWTPDQQRRLMNTVGKNVKSVGDGEVVLEYNQETAALVRQIRRGERFDTVHRRADVVEVDVMPCGTGEIVVFHDSDLSSRDGGTRGLTDASGTVWETDCETVTSAEVLESGETVPLLTAVMDAIPPEVDVNLEFKDKGNLSWSDFAEKTLAIADDYDNDILVSSFAEGAVAAVAERYPDVPIAFLFWNDIEAGLDVTDEYDCDAMNVPYNMVQGAPFFSDNIGFDNIPSGGYADVDLVEEAENRDIDLNVWTVQNWYQADQLVKAGVDGLISDFPNVL